MGDSRYTVYGKLQMNKGWVGALALVAHGMASLMALVLCASACSAHTGKHFTHYETKDGAVVSRVQKVDLGSEQVIVVLGNGKEVRLFGADFSAYLGNSPEEMVFLYDPSAKRVVFSNAAADKRVHTSFDVEQARDSSFWLKERSGDGVDGLDPSLLQLLEQTAQPQHAHTEQDPKQEPQASAPVPEFNAKAGSWNMPRKATIAGVSGMLHIGSLKKASRKSVNMSSYDTDREFDVRSKSAKAKPATRLVLAESLDVRQLDQPAKPLRLERLVHLKPGQMVSVFVLEGSKEAEEIRVFENQAFRDAPLEKDAR